MTPPAFAALLGMLLAPTFLCAGEIVCRFDNGTDPEVNDFGERQGAGTCALAAPGSGCPANPQGRALDTGEPGGAANAIEIPLAAATSLAQGTLEAWVKSTWDWSSDRDHHAFLSIKMEGGTWQSLSLYHHGRMGDARALAFNIHDGIDNCILTPVEALGWRQGEWHHLAASWTPNSQWLFADGRLVAKRLTEGPVSFTAPAGPLRIGGPGLWGSAAGVLIDDVRFVGQALYAGLESIPVPTAPLPERLPTRLLARAGVALTASSTMASLCAETDVAELHVRSVVSLAPAYREGAAYYNARQSWPAGSAERSLFGVQPAARFTTDVVSGAGWDNRLVVAFKPEAPALGHYRWAVRGQHVMPLDGHRGLGRPERAGGDLHPQRLALPVAAHPGRRAGTRVGHGPLPCLRRRLPGRLAPLPCPARTARLGEPPGATLGRRLQSRRLLAGLAGA